MESYSALMSVYAGADAVHFQQAVQSMMQQTQLPEEFVLVCDGPLTGALEDTLNVLLKTYPDQIRVVRLKENLGIGAAQNIGMQHCKMELVAKLDADDLALPDRCRQQLEVFAEDPELAVVGGWIAEFAEDPGSPYALRKVPENQEAILRFSRRRQPFNNTTVMYRRSAVLAVGGYRNYRRGEDYDLNIRLLNAGYKAKNLQKVLTKVRVDRDALCRRVSWQTVRCAFCTRWNAYRMGYASGWDFCIGILGQLVLCFVPIGLRLTLIQHFLRQPFCGDNL